MLGGKEASYQLGVFVVITLIVTTSKVGLSAFVEEIAG